MPDVAASDTAMLQLPTGEIELPIHVGTENEHAIDISRLRSETGMITLDEGYRNTGSVRSDITFINGEQGVLRYRGYSIEDVCEHLDFIDTSLLLINGELPTSDERAHFADLLTKHQMIHEGVTKTFDGFPDTAEPMAILSAMINTISCYQPQITNLSRGSDILEPAAMLISKVRTVAAAVYKTSVGQPHMYPDPAMGYCENFFHMMFSLPHAQHTADPDVVKALDLILTLHADHEQNCSTSTVRMVGSSGANLFASCSAGVCALWGPLHGGANVAVLKQLTEIYETDTTIEQHLEKVKNKKALLYGFGHGVYKNYDPRARILKSSVDKVLDNLGGNDPLLKIARDLEAAALADDYFVSRKLYPNVDFYSGILMQAMGIPMKMFTVMFAIGRMPGWIAQWKEVRDQKSRIYRPRQLYTGPAERKIPAQRG